MANDQDNQQTSPYASDWRWCMKTDDLAAFKKIFSLNPGLIGNHLPMESFLLKHGTLTNIADHSGESALGYAALMCSRYRSKILRLLGEGRGNCGTIYWGGRIRLINRSFLDFRWP
jgi:hypothetical protein